MELDTWFYFHFLYRVGIGETEVAEQVECFAPDAEVALCDGSVAVDIGEDIFDFQEFVFCFWHFGSDGADGEFSAQFFSYQGSTFLGVVEGEGGFAGCLSELGHGEEFIEHDGVGLYGAVEVFGVFVEVEGEAQVSDLCAECAFEGFLMPAYMEVASVGDGAQRGELPHEVFLDGELFDDALFDVSSGSHGVDAEVDAEGSFLVEFKYVSFCVDGKFMVNGADVDVFEVHGSGVAAEFDAEAKGDGELTEHRSKGMGYVFEQCSARYGGGLVAEGMEQEQAFGEGKLCVWQLDVDVAEMYLLFVDGGTEGEALDVEVGGAVEDVGGDEFGTEGFVSELVNAPLHIGKYIEVTFVEIASFGFSCATERFVVVVLVNESLDIDVVMPLFVAIFEEGDLEVVVVRLFFCLVMDLDSGKCATCHAKTKFLPFLRFAFEGIDEELVVGGGME